MLKLHQTLKAAFPEQFRQAITHTSYTDFIKVDDCDVTFTFQEGAAKEHSTSGVLVEDVIKFAERYIFIMDSHISCDENKKAMYHLQQALASLDARTADRIKRNVEGTSND